MAWSPDSAFIVSSTAYAIYLWDTVSGALINKQPYSRGYPISWSPDSKLIAHGSEKGEIVVWDSTLTKKVRTLKCHKGQHTGLQWAPNGKMLAATKLHNVLEIWDFNNLDQPVTYRHTNSIWCCSWIPDSTQIVLGCRDDHTRIFDVTSAKVLEKSYPVTVDVMSVAVSPDGKYLIAGGSYTIAKVFELGKVKPVHVFPRHPPRIYAVAWSPRSDAISLQSLEGSTPYIFNLDNQTLESKIEGGLGTRAAWSPDNSELASTGRGDTFIWSTINGKRQRKLEGSVKLAEGIITWSPDGNKIARGDVNQILINDATTGKLLNAFDDEGYVHDVKWSPNSEQIAASCGNGKHVKIWKVDTGKVIHTIHPKWYNHINFVEWSPDANYIWITGQGKSETWSVSTGKLHKRLSGALGYECAIAWNLKSNRKCILHFLGDVKFWAETNSDPEKHVQSPVVGGGFALIAPDNKTALTLSGYPAKGLKGGLHQQMIHFWELETGKRLGNLLLLNDNQHLIVSPEGHFRGSPDVAKELGYIVETDAGQETLTESEFQKKYGWKNDPTKAIIYQR